MYGLPTQNSYFFGVSVMDDQGNWSKLSDIPDRFDIAISLDNKTLYFYLNLLTCSLFRYDKT